ncbi:sperm-tail PG-rich repeat-containing protein 2-like [Anoplophora glabripennis]|uniref:sperm-tail PG-rich repeat-containing protein 2-like n=1 Tax=Anoplophora glabripennis TaxID=217634 RepID=UPI0008756B50|nr:sperm-tail PG-rich repeat-containing protein 2-like [Anoplophora glabripennis]
MYNRAPRVTELGSCQTTPDVGPATYFLTEDRDKRVNVVPFLSSEEKVPKFYQKKLCEAFYDIPGSIGSVKGGSTPRNRAPRFVTKESDTPSPGDYDSKIEIKCKRTIPCGVRPKKLYVCRIPFSVKGSAPSMPIDSYGYNLTRNESLIKIPPKELDLTLGPAYYQVPCDIVSHSDKGCKWSSRTGKRPFYETVPGPGPAAYDVELPKYRKRAEEDEVREMARRFSFVPRYLEAQELKYLKEDLPGPADYSTEIRDICKVCPSLKPRPFICGSKRVTITVSDNPGPAEYDIGNVAKYPVSKRDVPFSIESSRFDKRKIVGTPGPGSYNIKSPLIERILKKKNQYSLIEIPFNNTAKRDVSAVDPFVASSPSPANYCKETQGRCKIFVTSVFKSKTVRFKPICKKNEVSPATYNVTNAFNNATEKISHQAMEVSFNATAARKGIISEEVTPGPADYCKQISLSDKGYYIPVSPRFEQPPSGPGPGTYHGNSVTIFWFTAYCRLHSEFSVLCRTQH